MGGTSHEREGYYEPSRDLAVTTAAGMFAYGQYRPPTIWSGPPGNRTRISELKRLVRYRYASGPGPA